MPIKSNSSWWLVPLFYSALNDNVSMKKTRPVWAAAHPFWITKTQLENANMHFQPTVGIPHTIVWITSVYDEDIELVATFSPATPIANGVSRVAGKQTVDTNVEVDFSKVLPLHWMASVLKKGDISPNQLYQPYSGNMDTFTLPLNKYITLTHKDGVWQIPEYDAEEYMVNVGFGLGMEYISWGYSVPCFPQKNLILKAGSYKLVRSNGQEQIGDPVALDQGDWAMPMGYTYTLAFDSRGNGILTRQ